MRRPIFRRFIFSHSETGKFSQGTDFEADKFCHGTDFEAGKFIRGTDFEAGEFRRGTDFEAGKFRFPTLGVEKSCGPPERGRWKNRPVYVVTGRFGHGTYNKAPIRRLFRVYFNPLLCPAKFRMFFGAVGVFEDCKKSRPSRKSR